MRCKFVNHEIDALDYLTHTREDGKTFSYCTSHEPLTDAMKERLTKWATITPSTGP